MKELKIAQSAALAAGKIIKSYYGKKFTIRHKGEINLVTEVDEKAQKTILKIIQKAFPKDAILAEEGDKSKTEAAPRRWIVDPLDGTTNFAHGYPMFCVSIGFERDGKMECGVIYDPLRPEMFHAVRGKGAFLNKKRISVSKPTELRKALLVTGFPYDLDNPKYNNVPIFLHMLKKAQAIRRDGSAALNLAYVAAGRFDGFWELGLSPWDIAAGMLLIEEAGGTLSNFAKDKMQITDHHLIAAGPGVFGELQSHVHGSWIPA